MIFESNNCTLQRNSCKRMTSFVSLLTESGKSFIYAVLPFAFDHLRGSEGSIVVVVSPLLSRQSQQGRKYIALKHPVIIAMSPDKAN